MTVKFPAKISTYDLIDSAMSEAHRLIESDQAIHGQLLLAHEQTNGRGRLKRQWVSSKGNFMGSLILQLTEPLAKLSELSFVTALAVGETIKSLIPNDNIICYKWPNDVLVNQYKIAGILLEALEANRLNFTWLIIGIGINIKSFPPNTQTPATCLNEFSKANIDYEQVQLRLCSRFQTYFQIWKEQGFSPIRQLWLKNAASHGKMINILNGSETLTGKFIDLDSQGRLVIETKSGEIINILAGDVFFPELRMNN